MNSVVLIGRLGGDPRGTFSSSEVAIVKLSVGVTELVLKNEEWVARTVWNDVTCYGREAEYAKKNLVEGSKVSVEGRIETMEIVDVAGLTRKITEIIATKVVDLSPRKAMGEG